MEYLLFICTEPFTPDEDPNEDMEKSTTCDEAIRLARSLTALMPDEPEAGDCMR
jgi:predicted RNA polymerase sigma factor